MKKLLASIFLTTILILPFSASARPVTQIYDWYIKDFESEIIVNKDSSLDITEKIIADCGNASDKHGIFRVLPTVYYPENGKKVKTPIQLISITDFSGVPYNYSTTKEGDTVSWKIGDADITVTGENEYLIKYHVKNTIRFDNESFDEFYWNISGNFWDLEIDRFEANIVFPYEITRDNTEIYNYVGSYGINSISDIESLWIDPNTLHVKVNRPLDTREGVTTSVIFPKEIVFPPVLTFWEKYSDTVAGIIIVFIPLLTLLICFRAWSKYGKDFKLGRAIAPEFEIPEKMNPMEMGVFLDNGGLKSKYISASIVNLAVKGFIRIEDIPKKGIFSSANTKFIRTEKEDLSLTKAEKNLLTYIFESAQEKLLSDLKNKFYSKIPLLKTANFEKLKKEKLFETEGFRIQSTMFAIGFILLIALFFIPALTQALALYPILAVCTATIFIFASLMPRRSREGADLLGRIKGFKMYMMTAEKYRQKFNEKENIFERFLPYAMMFGITTIWVNKMKEMYGEEYFNNYHPLWYAGALHSGAFNIDNFTSQLSSLTSSMSSTMSSSPSSSGSGGGGFSGGGGGGGGGSGW